MEWIAENLATIIVGGLLIAAVTAALRSMLKAHKAGNCSCGGTCTGCSCSGNCPHSNQRGQTSS